MRNQDEIVLNPSYTRFSTKEVCEMLGTTQHTLSHLSIVDCNTHPVADIDDSSRRQYYNYWSIVRISLHLRLGWMLPIKSSRTNIWVDEIEDDLQDFLERENNGQLHTGLIHDFRKILRLNDEKSLQGNSVLALLHNMTEREVKLNYLMASLSTVKKVSVLLMEENQNLAEAESEVAGYSKSLNVRTGQSQHLDPVFFSENAQSLVFRV